MWKAAISPSPRRWRSEVLSARPYAYLDDAPLEERRTQAVMSRRWMDPQSASDIGKLDPAAIARVREEAWPDAGNADQLHDALLWLTLHDECRKSRASRAGQGCSHELMTQRRVDQTQRRRRQHLRRHRARALLRSAVPECFH